MTVGNHELWHDPATDGADSFEKLLTIYEVCTAVGAHATPALLEGSAGRPGVAVVPLQSWYHCNFLRSGPVVDAPHDHPLRMMDGGCKWPPAVAKCSTSAGLSRLFARCNEEVLAQALGTAAAAGGTAATPPPPAVPPGYTVVSFSHFLPHAQLHRTHPSALADRLGDVEGSQLLGAQVRVPFTTATTTSLSSHLAFLAFLPPALPLHHLRHPPLAAWAPPPPPPPHDPGAAPLPRRARLRPQPLQHRRPARPHALRAAPARQPAGARVPAVL